MPEKEAGFIRCEKSLLPRRLFVDLHVRGIGQNAGVPVQ
jgi:hypothetical protein